MTVKQPATSRERLDFIFDLVCHAGLTYEQAREACMESTMSIEDAIAKASQEELPLYLAHTDGNVRVLAEMRLKEVQGMPENSKKEKKRATRREILNWIYNRMKDGGVSFATANEEAKEKFEIVKLSEKEEEDNGENGSDRS